MPGPRSGISDAFCARWPYNPGGVFDIGASLAAARETRGYSLADAERLTHVRVKYLAALERGEFDALPGRTYARAFLRTYATALGLEPDRFVAAFEEMVPEPAEEPIAVGTPRRRHVIRPTFLAAIAAVGVVVGVAAWGASSHNTKTPPQTPVAVPTAQVTTKPKTVVQTGTTARSGSRTQPTPLVIRATRGDCWLLVRRGGADGAVVYEGTLQYGATVRFAATPLWVRFGAPWNVVATRDGTPLAGLGGRQPVDLIG